MKLYGWQKVGSADEYREMIKAEYLRLQREKTKTGERYGLEEVKLRLFLSLLDPVSTKTESHPSKHDEEQGLSSVA
jgi:hypothetical protein